MKKILLITLSIFLLLVVALSIIWFLGYRGERNMIQHGNQLVEKVEKYKETHKKLPQDLKDIGVDYKTEDSLFYYSIRDSKNYMIWYGTELGESKTYYSDSKKWEDFQR
jgi:uncharacterized protein YxeA